jgi:benzoate 4-monooxygenase
LGAEAASADSSAVILAVIKETMRLHSPFPTAFPRVIAAGGETAIPDLAAPLPVGSLVAASTYVLGRSKEIWGDDADMWKLERWPGDEKGIKRLEDKFVAISKGPRVVAAARKLQC